MTKRHSTLHPLFADSLAQVRGGCPTTSSTSKPATGSDTMTAGAPDVTGQVTGVGGGSMTPVT